jgi:chromosome segregation ATPase
MCSTLISIPNWAEAKGSPEVVNTLYTILEKTQEAVDGLFDDIIESGETIPPGAQEKYDEAMDKWEDSQALYDMGEYEDAAEKAIEALNKFGEAIKEANYEPEDKTETEKAIDLYNTLEKVKGRLGKLREIVEKLKGQEEDRSTTEIDEILDMVKDLLDEAEEHQDDGEYEDAREKIVEATKLLGQMTGRIHSLGNQKREEKVEKFMNKALERVQKLQGNFNALLTNKGVNQEKTKGINNMFNGILTQLKNLNRKGINLNYDELIDELDDLDEDLDEIFEDESSLDKKTSNRIKQIEKLEAKLESYRERINELEELGQDITELEEMLDEVESLLNQAYEELKTGNLEASEDKIEQADEILEDIDEMID